MNSRKYDICNVDVLRASQAKHLRCKKHIAKQKQNELFIPVSLVEESIEHKTKKDIILDH